tara:strand:- start:486 stop:587 length:102 start_codon:yes stop_codon:yes gene_type:complete
MLTQTSLKAALLSKKNTPAKQGMGVFIATDPSS